MKITRTYKYITSHELNKNKEIESIVRYIKWNVATRLVRGKHIVPYVNDTRLLIGKGLHAANANYYTGLKEYADMSFVIHLLRQEDVFVDVGANVGIYSILAAAVAGAELYAFEPNPTTFQHLIDNLALNQAIDRSHLFNKCVGAQEGHVSFENVSQLPSTSHVVTGTAANSDNSYIQIPQTTLDLSLKSNPTCIKIDVEGYELEVIRGAASTLSNPSLNAVIMETNGLSDQHFGIDGSQLHNIMLDQGFSTHKYDPMNRELTSLNNKPNSKENTLYIRDLDFVTKRLKESPTFAVHGWDI